MNTSLEYILNRASMVALIIAGIIFIYQGLMYIKMKNNNPDLPDKLYVAGSLTLFIGVVEILFGVAHFWIPV